MTFSEDILMAYVDGELDAHTCAQIEAAMLANPQIAERVAQHKLLRDRIHRAFEGTLAEPVPERLLAAVDAAPAEQRESNVVPLLRKESRRWSWPEWGSIAASLVVGAALSLLLMRPDIEPLTARKGKLFANGALAQALSAQLASHQPASSPVQIGISFRAGTGAYCRTFALRDENAFAGLACRGNDGWRVDVLARTETGNGPSAQYRQAASSMPKAVLQSVEDRIAGEPLDAQGEAAAAAAGWAAPR